jgi:hypothetical protein
MLQCTLYMHFSIVISSVIGVHAIVSRVPLSAIITMSNELIHQCVHAQTLSRIAQTRRKSLAALQKDGMLTGVVFCVCLCVRVCACARRAHASSSDARMTPASTQPKTQVRSLPPKRYVMVRNHLRALCVSADSLTPRRTVWCIASPTINVPDTRDVSTLEDSPADVITQLRRKSVVLGSSLRLNRPM